MKDDFRDRSHLTTVQGERSADQPRRGQRLGLDEDEQVSCWACEKDIGVATSAVVEVTVAPRRTPTGKKAGGTKQWACAYCLSRGKMTVVIEG